MSNGHLLWHMSRPEEVAIFVSDVTSMKDQVVATAERVEELWTRENYILKCCKYLWQCCEVTMPMWLLTAIVTMSKPRLTSHWKMHSWRSLTWILSPATPSAHRPNAKSEQRQSCFLKSKSRISIIRIVRIELNCYCLFKPFAKVSQTWLPEHFVSACWKMKTMQRGTKRDILVFISFSDEKIRLFFVYVQESLVMLCGCSFR